MPTPKKKTSRSRRNMRRSHDGIEIQSIAVAVDKKTKELVRPHRAFKAADGAFYYKGKQISAATE